eukprot:CAMPEP_0174357484 /NCGR_PEP_ID=MMETSP0811_2-20130205/36320_1 /TAXON_ID=73025 ORGANISM="Eutreptiella gymnastica-like, Strain CCMP1594" /NCGR_SAMPLE_ID=MMETSP0811_2 /ASSEMBLY_ACC=CAM_ASM_000667 /LENGTH=41 /DNA_ID= /DNA_START= /DNA_END= /DNA_ORIENTATION=
MNPKTENPEKVHSDEGQCRAKDKGQRPQQMLVHGLVHAMCV